MVFSSNFMGIKSSQFSRDKLLILLNISWLFQLKKISHNYPAKSIDAAILYKDEYKGLVIFLPSFLDININYI